MRFVTIGIIALLLCVAPVFAQTDSDECPLIIEEILSEVDEICADTARNQACYGHLAMEVIARSGDTDFQFERVGDIADIDRIETLRLSPMDTENGAWGVVLLQLQASLPATLPGQNVTVLLFGDVELTNAVSSDNSEANPMQAFYLSTGIGIPVCHEAPENGMIVQTPEGVGQVAFAMNGVDISLGSTVFFQAQADAEMRVSVLEGAAATMYDEVVYSIIGGTQLDIPLGENLLPSDVPGLLAAIDPEILDTLPLTLLDAARQYVEPLTEEQLQTIQERLSSGGALCGEPPFPSCEDYPWLVDWEWSGIHWGETGFGDLEWTDAWADYDWDDSFAELRQELLAEFDPDDYTLQELEFLLRDMDLREMIAFLAEHDIELPDSLRERLGLDGLPLGLP